MDFFLTMLATVLSMYFMAITAYLCVIAVAAYFFKKRVSREGRPMRLAVVIPAHNEEMHIAETVGSLFASHYPRELYEVFVIADNCDDRTAARALQAGSRVFSRVDPSMRGKGQAVDWFLRSHGHVLAFADAIVMIDADTWVDKEFLREMAASLRYPGVAAVQGYYGVANARAAWRSGLLSAAFHVFNHLRPAGHRRLGGTAGLRGNGMAFKKEVLAGGWPAHSIVEDYEFSVMLLLRGIVVDYNPDAMVFSDMPTERKVAETQRMRWEGIDPRIKHRLRRLMFRKLAGEPRIRYLDALIDSFVPPLALIVLGQSLLFVMALMLRSPLVVPLACCFCIDMFYVLSGLILRGAGAAEWRSLLKAPSYMLWKIAVYFKMRNQDASVWNRTERPSGLPGA